MGARSPERWSFSRVVAAAAILAVAGCDRTVEQACGDLAAAQCDYYEACSPVFVVLAYGDADACRARVAARCTPLPSLHGSHTTAGDIDACASAYDGYSCEGLLLHAVPAECQFAGDLPNGAACAAGAQCASANCAAGPDSACGECAAMRREGDNCSKGGSPCAAGLYCGDDSRCAVPAALGEMCNSTTPCSPTAWCSAGTCLAAAALGEPCSAGQKCDPLAGLACNEVSGVCEEQHISEVGEACGVQPSGLVFACAASAVCEGGMCVAARDIGEPCGASDGAIGAGECLPGLACVAGVCALELVLCDD